MAHLSVETRYYGVCLLCATESPRFETDSEAEAFLNEHQWYFGYDYVLCPDCRDESLPRDYKRGRNKLFKS